MVGRSVGTKLTGRNLRPRIAGGMRCIDQRWMIDRISPRAIQPNPNMCVVSRTCVFFILCISINGRQDELLNPIRMHRSTSRSITHQSKAKAPFGTAAAACLSERSKKKSRRTVCVQRAFAGRPPRKTRPNELCGAKSQKRAGSRVALTTVMLILLAVPNRTLD